ncbi:unnamed protein product [Phytomonas sp. EM1]|nr:unnamed protein product [Phytomonas sp. EM1]|eukprot:CCW63014.1 unnamed protein product [Phytomonas sp. isolate EM1]
MRDPSLRLFTKPHKERENFPLMKAQPFFFFALFLGLMTDVNVTDSSLSTTITSSYNPSALQQLATFADLEATAEEEHLGWGSFASLEASPRPDPCLRSQLLQPSDHDRGLQTPFASSFPSQSLPPPLPCLWEQLDVMEAARLTHDEGLLDATRRLLQQGMFSVIYRCELRVREGKGVGEDAAGGRHHWSCVRCHHSHPVVRESCTRCGAPSAYTKLFCGQIPKEMRCEGYLAMLLRATHPEIPIPRIECHLNGSKRGKGCASIYVYHTHVRELEAKLHHNVFFDILHTDPVGGGAALVAYYVYTEQRQWLQAFAAVRVAQDPFRPSYLPRGLMVMEEAKNTTLRGATLATCPPREVY